MKVLENQKGLSLVEVVAALFIFSIALLFLSNFLVRSFEISGNQDQRQVAMNLARQTIEEWKDGQGMIPNNVEQDEALDGFPTEKLAKPLSFEDIIDKLPAEGELTVQLKPITVNERTYQVQVLLRKVTLGNQANQDNPLIGIVVIVASNQTELAKLETLMPNPEIG